MNILGISCFYHDSAAALIADGKIIAAAEEERFSRIKHDNDFPKSAIEFCLQTAGIETNELDYLVFYEKPLVKFERILVSSISTFPQSLLFFRNSMHEWLTKKLWIKSIISTELKLDNPNKILFIDHHLSHAASCFYPSPYKKSAVLTIDGVGEWTTAAIGIGDGHAFEVGLEMLAQRAQAQAPAAVVAHGRLRRRACRSATRAPSRSTTRRSTGALRLRAASTMGPES